MQKSHLGDYKLCKTLKGKTGCEAGLKAILSHKTLNKSVAFFGSNYINYFKYTQSVNN